MRKAVLVLVSLAFILSIATVIMITSDSPVTLRAIFGNINLYISSGGPTIFIHSPLNTTYTFAIGSNYTLDLNVSTPSLNVSVWWFTLEDLFHNTILNQSQIFTPNISFNAARRSNKLTVYANDTFGEIGSKSVIFYVAVPNSAPLLGNVSRQLYACENGALNYRFNATDVDEESLTVSVAPTTPFFVFPSSFSGLTFVESDLFSGTLTKADIGNYTRTLSVSDGNLSDSKEVNITVIEINNAPSMDNIGVQTVYTSGQNSTFYKQVMVTDTENGNSTGGNISFNISFNQGVVIFNISTTGVMNYTGNSSHVGVHNITVCATDRTLSFIHPNISLCGVTGLNITVCNNFTLTVTDQNRDPTIIDYYPTETIFNDTANYSFIFNVTTFDPDLTIPDVYWYLNGQAIQYNAGNTTTWLGYNWNCGVDGLQRFKAEVTDGLVNDSVSWNITLTGIACPSSAPGTSVGAGAAGGAQCISRWGCNDWQVCQNAKTSLEVGILSGEDYRTISETCSTNSQSDAECGYQTRSCFDNSYCNVSRFQPPSVQTCLYTVNPSCVDGLKNCHDGSCELLVDCGGPCGVCPSCSDGIQNQGELDVDCGGPCPFQCPSETPFLGISIWRTIIVWLFWLLLLILLIILIRKIIKLIHVHSEMQRVKRIQEALSK